ncbi:MAG: VWA domain-containing protein [Bryobacteraceae bacterium]
MTSTNYMSGLARVVLAGMLLSPGWAQQPEQKDPVITVNVKVVVAPTTVTDQNGNVVNGLKTEDFLLLDNGKPQRITEDVASHPISLVILVQNSQNMEKVLAELQKTGSLFESLVLGETGEVAVVSYDHRIKTVLDFTPDVNKVGAAFKLIKAGSTQNRLNDAVMHGINLLRNRPSSRRRTLLIIGETRDRSSESRLREVLTAAEFQNVTIYSVDVSTALTTMTTRAQPPRPSPIPPGGKIMANGQVETPTIQSQNQLGNWTPTLTEIFKRAKGVFVDNPVEVYTKYTGGREFGFLSQHGLERALSQVGEQLHSQYLLAYSVSEATGGYHEIEVRVNRPGLKVTTRRGYWIAGPSER